jgi:hypothetical protein
MNGLSVSGPIFGCEGLGMLYLGQDRSVREWAIYIEGRICMHVYGLAVSRSR